MDWRTADRDNRKRLHFTDNYVWSSTDVLGKGAYGEVFKCRNLRTGQLAAVKVTKGYSASDETEINILKSLDHVNIIKVLAVETYRENRRQTEVMVMEYCSGKSLHHFLEEPINCFGLDDKYFLIFLHDIIAALEYLHHAVAAGKKIVHRDIKPLNILITYKESTGQPIFKLSDFGTAKIIKETQDEVNTLVGTPEYLQPDMFYHYTHQSHYMRGDFNARGVDLWPLGTSIYYAACGSLPFRPFGSLNDSSVRKVMCDMIQNKAKGVISAIQTPPSGKITYSKTLPETCRLSIHLQTLILPFLAEVLVAQPDPKYEYVKAVDDIVQRKFVRYFIPHTGYLACIYVRGEISPQSVWSEISKVHDSVTLPQSDFELWWKGFPVNEERTMSQIDAILEEEPVMVIRKNYAEWPEYSMNFPYEVNKSALKNDEGDPGVDKKVARQVTGKILRIIETAKYLRDVQLQMNKYARYVDSFTKSRVDTFYKPTMDMAQITTQVANMFDTLKKVREALPSTATIQSMDKPFRQIEEMCLKANSITRESDDLNTTLSTIDSWTDDDVCSVECEDKLQFQANGAISILADFKADLDLLKEHRQVIDRDQLQQWNHIHKLDRMQLSEMYDKCIEHLHTKCLKRTKELSKKLSVWSKTISEKQKRVDVLEEDYNELSKLKETLQLWTREFGLELSNYIRNRVRHVSKTSSDKNEIFERARLALEESSRTLEDFSRRYPTNVGDSFVVCPSLHPSGH